MLTLFFGVVLAACASSAPNTADNEGPDATDQPEDSVTTTLEPIGLDELPDSDLSASVFVECMTRKGFDASVLENGDVFIDHPDEQLEAVQQASAECDQELVDAGLIPDPQRPPSEELLRFDYEREIGIRECLIENGYPVGEVPSWEAYLDMRTRGEEGGPHWDPLEEVEKTGDSDLVHEAYALCVPSYDPP